MHRFAPIALLLTASLGFAAEKETEAVKIGPVTYQIPATWQRQQPTNTMRIAQFGVPLADGDSGKVEFIVFYFGGQGGSAEDNIKRWAGMFEDVQGEKKVNKMEVGALKITELDIAGTYKDKPFPMSDTFTPRKDYRMLAAVVETPDDGPYFFRFVGPAKTIKGEEEAWKNMLKTAATKD
jgi:hypothetical protein